MFNHKFVCLPLLALFSANSALAQPAQQTATPQRYSNVLYLKVPAANEAALIDFYKTGPGGKAVRARMKADSNRIGWSLRRVLYPGEHNSGANFLILAATNGIQPEGTPAQRDEISRAATGMSYAEYMQKARSMSEVIGTTLSHVHHITDGFSFAEGDVVVARRLKTPAGKTQELTALLRDVRFPFLNEGMKSGGGRAKGWAWAHLTFPSGESLPYDVTETTVYKDLASAVQGPGNAGSAASMERFMKLFPGRNYIQYMNSRRDLEHLVRTDIYRVEVAIRP